MDAATEVEYGDAVVVLWWKQREMRRIMDLLSRRDLTSTASRKNGPPTFRGEGAWQAKLDMVGEQSTPRWLL
jgi:hypothetical protein